MKRIESKTNATLKVVASLGQKKYRDRYQLYVAEGLRVVSDMLHSPSVQFVMIDETQLEKEEVQSILTKCETRGIPLYQLADGLQQKVSFTEHSQGIWAVLKMEMRPVSDLLTYWDTSKIPLTSSEIYLCLDQVQDPGNLGTIIRTAVAIEAKGILVTKGSVDIYNPKTVRSTMSALTKIPIYTQVDEKELLTLLDHPSLETYALTPKGAVAYHTVDYAKRSMLLFGNEGHGLSDTLVERASHRIYIPMPGDIESLNLSVAAAVTMYKVWEQS